MSDKIECPKCGGQMAQGFIPLLGDAGALSGAVLPWVAGAPETGRFLGMAVGLNVKDKEVVPIGVFRCEACGFIEAYARNEFARASS